MKTLYYATVLLILCPVLSYERRKQLCNKHQYLDQDGRCRPIPYNKMICARRHRLSSPLLFCDRCRKFGNATHPGPCASKLGDTITHSTTATTAATNQPTTAPTSQNTQTTTQSVPTTATTTTQDAAPPTPASTTPTTSAAISAHIKPKDEKIWLWTFAGGSLLYCIHLIPIQKK